MAGDPRGEEQPNASAGITDLPVSFWVAAVLTGIAAGLGAMAMMAVLRAVQHAVFAYHHGTFSAAVARRGTVRRMVVVTAGGVVAGVGWWILRRRAGGTGGEPTAAVWQAHPDLSPLRTLASGTLSEVVIGMGGSLGREAAPQHIGAAAGSWLGQRIGLSRHHRVLLVACGAGAGVGAVYNVPLAGALFAAELYLGSLSLATVVPALVTSGIATAVAWTTLPPKFLYHVTPASFPSISTVVFAVVAGPVLGLAAAGYVRLVGWASDHQPRRGWLLVAPVAAFAVLAAAALEYPLLLGNGRDLAQWALTGGGTLAVVAAVAALKPLVTAGCLGSGASGGLFTPTFSFGAVLGLLFGHLWSMLWPGSLSTASLSTASVIGAAAVLAAAMEAPIAALVFAIELTGVVNASLMPLAIAVAGAILVSRHIEARSIYSARLPRPSEDERRGEQG